MKRSVYLIFLSLLIYSCDKEEKIAPNTYQINVSAKGVYNGMRAYIKHIDTNRNEIIIDTAIVMNETFSFNGKVGYAAMHVISINGIQGNIPFVLEPERITIEINKDDIGLSKIGGSKNNEAFNVFISGYKTKVDAITEIRNQLKIAVQENDLEAIDALKTENTEKSDALKEFPHDFIDKNPNSEVSLLILESQLIGVNQNIERFKSNLDALKKVIDKNPSYKLIGQKISSFIRQKEALAFLDIGKIAPNFSAPNPEGKIVSLNDIKGKVTIIDFWASWCKPCRMENPNVVRVYKKYHEKGLEIISVSLDKDSQKDRWLKAIEDDNMNWHHVSNLKFWSEPVARMYNIRSIPATFILDENGKIIAKGLRGLALDQKIAELLD